MNLVISALWLFGEFEEVGRASVVAKDGVYARRPAEATVRGVSLRRWLGATFANIQNSIAALRAHAEPSISRRRLTFFLIEIRDGSLQRLANHNYIGWLIDDGCTEMPDLGHASESFSRQ
ncbi:MAG: hypothetical protein OXI01_23300 [Albidovulum sp.]|nr:hypothetical protein [Albidovulum sp.]